MKKILTIDGGGIRGIIPATIIAYIEQQIQHQSKNKDARISDYFDLFSGTSTGGILAALYITPSKQIRDIRSSSQQHSQMAASIIKAKYSAKEVLEFYKNLGPELFDLRLVHKLKSGFGFMGSKYSEESLERFAKNIFGDIYISEVIKDCLISSYDMTSRKAHFFSRYSTGKYGDSAEYTLADVARSTSAAPTFFKPAIIFAKDLSVRHLVDGGVFANNPAMCAYVEAIKLWGGINPREEFILSLGTGKIEKPYLYEQTRRFGYLQWLFPIIDVLMSSVSEVVDFQVKQIFNLAQVPQNYIRIEPQLIGCSIRMDNASRKNIKALEAVAQRYIDHNGTQIEEVVKNLMVK